MKQLVKLTLLFFLFSGLNLQAFSEDKPSLPGKSLLIWKWSDKVNERIKNPLLKDKVNTCIFAISLGNLGVHRLYLGTKPIVPVMYTVTVGGFLILPLADVIAVLSSKDLSKYKNNPRFIMWIDQKGKETVTPIMEIAPHQE